MRTILCQDSLPWLDEHGSAGAIVTSIAELSELPQLANDQDEYERWFVRAAIACLTATQRGCPAIFLQTDRKVGGRLLSKAGLLMRAADAADSKLLWHKIVLRRGVGKVNLHRPG